MRKPRLLFANEAAHKYWPSMTLGALAARLFPPDMRDRFVAAERSLLEGAEAPGFDWGEEGLGGVRCWFAGSLSPLAEGGELAGYLCVFSEVTELKRSEARLRRSEGLLVDTHGVAHLGTWEWEVEQTEATWSAELYRIYGLTPEQYTPTYEGYLQKVHEEDRQRVIDATNRVLHEHIPYSHDERIFRPDGTMRYLHTWAYPVLDDNGKLVRLVGVCQDITDRKLAEEEVKRVNADLERRVAERTKTIEDSLRDLGGRRAGARRHLLLRAAAGR